MVRCVVKAKKTGTIADLNNRNDLTLVTDSQDVRAVKENFGNRPAVRDFDGFFVSTASGDYDEVYGFNGSVPYLSKSIWKITMVCK